MWSRPKEADEETQAPDRDFAPDREILSVTQITACCIKQLRNYATLAIRIERR
jgi:hypothetical protein